MSAKSVLLTAVLRDDRRRLGLQPTRATIRPQLPSVPRSCATCGAHWRARESRYCLAVRSGMSRNDMNATAAHTSEDLFLPEPVPHEVKYTIISVDDHVVEPRHMFEGRLPTRLQERAPKVVETPQGHQVWE